MNGMAKRCGYALFLAILAFGGTSACQSAPHHATENGEDPSPLPPEDGEEPGDGGETPDTGEDPDNGEPDTLTVQANLITFGSISNAKSKITGQRGAVAGTEAYQVTLSITRNGTEMMPNTPDITAYFHDDGSFTFTLQQVEVGDVVKLLFAGEESGTTASVSATLSATADQTGQDGTDLSGQTKRSCDTAVTGAWASGSCTSTPLALSNTGGADPFEDLTTSCMAANGSDCAKAAGGWSDATSWTYSNSRYENLKYQTLTNKSGEGFNGKYRHIFSAREERVDSTVFLLDGNARLISRTFNKSLPKGSYKVSMDTTCELIDDAGKRWGACDDPNYGTLSYNVPIGPLSMKVECIVNGQNPTTALFLNVLPHPTKTRFETEFAIPETCTQFALKVLVENDSDVFFKRYADSKVTTTNPDQSADSSLTNSFFRSYTIDNFSISPLAIGSGQHTFETEKGLADYFQILKKCEGEVCGKTFFKKQDGNIDIYNANNSVFLVDGPSPVVGRKQKSETHYNYEIFHQPGGDPTQTPISGHPYFFISRRFDEIMPWTIPTIDEVNTAASGLKTEQLSGLSDTLHLWAAVHNPSETALSPQFKLPKHWTLYAIVYLPWLRTADFTRKITTFEIVPDHLVKCDQLDSTGADQIVSCGEWLIHSQSSRSYIVEIPPSDHGDSGTISLLDSQQIVQNQLAVSVDPLAMDSHANYDEQFSFWGAVPVNDWDATEAETLFSDLGKHHLTDIITAAWLTCPTGVDCDFDERPLQKDVNGDGLIGTFWYLPMQNKNGSCITRDEIGADLANSGANPAWSALAAKHGVRIGYGLSSADSWAWKPTLDSANPESKKVYANAAFWQLGETDDNVANGKCETTGGDMDMDGIADWNTVVFEGNDAVTYRNEFQAADVLATMGNNQYNSYARVKEVLFEDNPGTTADRLSLYLDIPFSNIPGSRVNSDADCRRTGSIQKIYDAGALNAGIKVATLGQSVAPGELGAGVCRDIPGLLPITQARDLGNIHWSRSGNHITAYCYEGNDAKLNQTGCRLDFNLEPAQEDLLSQVAEKYKVGLEDANPGVSASELVVRHSNLYDELGNFIRGLDFFEGFGQLELISVTDIYEREGLRTINNNRESYALLEKYFREENPGARGMTYSTIIDAYPLASPLASYLNDYHRDQTDPRNQTILYEGGYGFYSPYDRYAMGLAREKIALLDNSRAPGALLWGYQMWLSDPIETDPDYLSGDKFKNDTARYVSSRDALDWGTSRYPLSFWGLLRAPLPNTPSGTLGDESIEYSNILMGIHDLWIAKSKVADPQVAAAIQSLPWTSFPAWIDPHMSSCAMVAALQPDDSWDPLTIAHDISCYCGNFSDDPSCQSP